MTQNNCNLQTSNVIGVQFSMMSPEEIRRYSVAEITSKLTFNGNRPYPSGLFDPRMGVLERGMLCPTDGLTSQETPGYFGHIELGKPIFYPQHINTIQKVANCFCFHCGKILINKKHHHKQIEFLKKKKGEPLKYVYKFCSDIKKSKSVKKCGDQSTDGCGAIQPSKIYIKQDTFATLIAEWKELKPSEEMLEKMFNNGAGIDAKRKKEDDELTIIVLTPEFVLSMFKKITDEDITFLGFNTKWCRPEWMICSVVPVPPPCVRPSVKHDAHQRSDDDLTAHFMDMITHNNDLIEKLKDPTVSKQAIDNLVQLLQYRLTALYDNKFKNLGTSTQRSGRELQCIKTRLNGKEGRVRGNLMGKRVNFSARSVITGDPNLSINQVGVPKKIAMDLTFPQYVNERNKNFLMKLVLNGPNIYPGAKKIQKAKGTTITLNEIDRQSIVLEVGDIVHRHMLDNDFVIFNRQPSLHRMSMLGHRAKVVETGDQFRINVGVTTPYNADFDGDEMNLHMPQSEASMNEIERLANVINHIISPSNNSPVIKMNQDSLLGSYLFTKKDIEFDKREAMNLCFKLSSIDPSLFAKEGKITSFELISQILPPLTLFFKSELAKEKETNEHTEDIKTSNYFVEITNGVMKRGQLSKGSLNGGGKGLIQRINNDFGAIKAGQFIDEMQSIVTEYLKTASFSVGISDLISDKKTKQIIQETLQKSKEKAGNLERQIHLGTFKNKTSRTNFAEFEVQVNSELNNSQNEVGKIGKKSLANSNFVEIVNSGSKGSAINISQMICCIGQQNIEGKRIPYGFENRTLPHFSKFDDSPTARGFVNSSYIKGLSPIELFFHAMGGRMGLIDTAVKTSKTGYIQRRLVKALEDLKVCYDMTVRNAKGKIIQYSYGDDNFDTTKVEKQELKLLDYSIDDIYAHYSFGEYFATENPSGSHLGVFSISAAKRMKTQKKDLEEYCKKYIHFMIEARDTLIEKIFTNNNDIQIITAVSFQFVIANIQGQLGLNNAMSSDITPKEAFEMIEEYFQKLELMESIKPNYLFKIMYFFYLSPRSLLVDKRFTKNALQLLLETILLRYKQSFVHPGEMVGILAGQSIGEPTTQMTLNSVIYETMIVVKHNLIHQSVMIGEFIDFVMENDCNKVIWTKENDTSYAECKTNFEIASIDTKGEISWKKIEAVTKHPVVNKDGTNTMLEIITERQRKVVATKAKSFLQCIEGEIVEIAGDQLRVGDYLPISLENDYDEEHKLQYIKLLKNDDENVDILTIDDNNLQYVEEKKKKIPNRKLDGSIEFIDKPATMDNVMFDRIISIREVKNTTNYAYDLTVQDTRNFILMNGLCMRDTFHLAGVASKSNVTQGVPRLEELLGMTEEPKNQSLTIYLRHFDQEDNAKAIKYATMIEHTRLVDVVNYAEIIHDPDDIETTIDEDRHFIHQFYEFEKIKNECFGIELPNGKLQKSNYILRLELNKEMLLDKNISMNDIHFALKNSSEGGSVECVFSDLNHEKLIFRIRNITQNNKKNKTRSNLYDQSQEIKFMKSFQNTLLETIVLRGVKGITNVLPRKLEKMPVKIVDKFVKKDIYVLDTTGANLLDTIALDFIDYKKTISNNVREMIDVFGIHVGRKILYDELLGVYRASGSSIDHHHLSVLVDRMTSLKNIIPVNKSGLFNDDVGPIAKACYEVTTEGFVNASRFGEFDPMLGVSSCVMTGQKASFGTNAFQLMLDEDIAIGTKELAIDMKTTELKIQEEFDENRQEDNECSKKVIEINNRIFKNSSIVATEMCQDDYTMVF